MENKTLFVKQYLKPLLMGLGENIVNAEYVKTVDSELVIITYGSGSYIEVNVHMDSLAALSRDVLKCI